MSSGPTHPYLQQPARAFWSRAVSRHWNAAALIADGDVILRGSDKIMSAGSCFAANIVPFLEAAGYGYVRTEIAEPGDRFGYGLYSASYGNIYTPRQLSQLLARADGSFQPVEDRWHIGATVVDPFRPGLPYPAESDEEFDLLTQSHLAKVIAAVAAADVFVFTLGLTETWASTADGAVFPACPGTIAGTFDPAKHRLVNLTAAETTADLTDCIARLRAINPRLRIVLTVSPVPLVATATTAHVYVATSYSKSVLRVAAQEVAAATPDVVYFPAYEIVTGPFSDGFFEADRRTVSQAGIAEVMRVLLGASEPPPAASGPRVSHAEKLAAAERLSLQLAQRECEEVMADSGLAKGD